MLVAIANPYIALSRSARRGRSRAFSLIEIIFVVIIIALVSAMAVPRFAGAIQRQRLSAAAQRIAADLNMARSRANFTSTTVTVSFTFSNNQYTVSGVPDLNRPLNTYTVTLADDPYKATLTSTTIGGVTQTSGTALISYSGFGTPSAGGTFTVAIGNSTKVVAVDAVTGKAVVQ